MRVRRTTRGSIGQLLAALFALALLASACGGDDDDAGGDDTSASSGATDDTGSDDTGSDGDDTGSDDTGSDGGDTGSDDNAGGDAEPAGEAAAAGTATVTIGDVTYVADQQVVCVQIGEAIGGSWNDSAGDISISIDLPPQDWETSPDGWSAPTVRVDDDAQADGPLQYQANPEMAGLLGLDDVGDSMVTSWRVDGSSASGSGLFVEFFGSMGAAATGDDPPAPVEGTFSLTCE